MMQVMRDIGGVEIPETLATLVGVAGSRRPTVVRLLMEWRNRAPEDAMENR